MNKPKHKCLVSSRHNMIESCYETEDGSFEVSINGGEYVGFVDFCPICGREAPKYKMIREENNAKG